MAIFQTGDEAEIMEGMLVQAFNIQFKLSSENIFQKAKVLTVVGKYDNLEVLVIIN